MRIEQFAFASKTVVGDLVRGWPGAPRLRIDRAAVVTAAKLIRTLPTPDEAPATLAGLADFLETFAPAWELTRSAIAAVAPECLPREIATVYRRAGYWRDMPMLSYHPEHWPADYSPGFPFFTASAGAAVAVLPPAAAVLDELVVRPPDAEIYSWTPDLAWEPWRWAVLFHLVAAKLATAAEQGTNVSAFLREAGAGTARQRIAIEANATAAAAWTAVYEANVGAVFASLTPAYGLLNALADALDLYRPNQPASIKGALRWA